MCYVRIILSGSVLYMHIRMYYTKWKRAMYLHSYVCILNGTSITYTTVLSKSTKVNHVHTYEQARLK